MAVNKAQLYRYKGNFCSCCGKSVDEMIERYGTFNRLFDLHHVVPSKKAENYENLIRQNLSTKQLDEVDKCVLLCKECHSVLHAQNYKTKAILSFEYQNQVRTQEVDCWLVVDKIDKTIKLIYEGDLLLEPYVETLNGNYENVIFAIDLNKTPYLIERLKSLREGDLYLVKNALSDKTLFLAERAGNLIKIKHEVEFRHITMDASRAKKGTRMWYRNGVVLHENGQVQSDGFVSFSLDATKFS
ncbi:TPA: HNH endonuclease [Vibrio parahaemolyticus]|nr:HNH endonuclease [Vibrio parahaemolyticus]